MLKLHVSLQVAPFTKRLAADMALVRCCTVDNWLIVMLVVQSNVLVEVAGITECTKTMSAFQRFEAYREYTQ